MQALLVLLLAAAAGDVGVPVLDHAVRKGDLIAASDLKMETRPPATARGALPIEAVAGMEAARNLAAGAVVRQNDVSAPQIVRRGEPVMVRVGSAPLAITTAGRALGSGAMGDMVRVVINATNRTLDGQIDAHGSVRIVSP